MRPETVSERITAVVRSARVKYATSVSDLVRVSLEASLTSK